MFSPNLWDIKIFIQKHKWNVQVKCEKYVNDVYKCYYLFEWVNGNFRRKKILDNKLLFSFTRRQMSWNSGSFPKFIR